MKQSNVNDLTKDDAGDDSDYFVCRGHLYSPAALIDDTGAITERYEYDVYGDVVIYTGTGASGWWDGDEVSSTYSNIGNYYLFTGRRFDILDSGSLKIYYYRARYYDPETGRFLSRDPIGYYDGMNLYEYCANNPVNWIDPWGLCKEDIGDKIDKFGKNLHDALRRGFRDPIEGFVNNKLRPFLERNLRDPLSKLPDYLRDDFMNDCDKAIYKGLEKGAYWARNKAIPGLKGPLSWILTPKDLGDSSIPWNPSDPNYPYYDPNWNPNDSFFYDP